MPAPFRSLTIEQLTAELACFAWTRRIWRVDMHHTFHPDHARWRAIGSAACMVGMWRHHVEERAFEDIAQHLTIQPDGSIWTGRDWNRTPASVGLGMNAGVFMLEAIGNFDLGQDRLEGAQLTATLGVIRAVQCRFDLPTTALLFHREVPQTEKTCPGTSIDKRAFLSALGDTPMPRAFEPDMEAELST